MEGDFFDLFPNVNAIWLRDLWPKRMHRLAQLQGITNVKLDLDHETGLVPWRDLCEAWPGLEMLLIYHECAAFGYPSQTSNPLTSLRTLELLECRNTTLNSIPIIAPNTLRTVNIESSEHVDGKVVERLFNQHSPSLESFSISSRHSIILSQPLSLVGAAQLRHFNIHSQSTATSPLVIEDTIPTTLIEVTIDWPSCTPEKAIGFLEGRGDGSMKLLDIRISAGDVRE